MKHDLTIGTWQDDTGCPISIILVTTSDVSDFRENNKRRVRKPYPRIPKISTTLRELEGFTYVTTLDLNTGY
jgi:hypothetical protein